MIEKYKRLLDKTLFNKTTATHLVIFLFLLNIVDLIQTVYAYYTIPGFYEINFLMNYLIEIHIVVFIIVKYSMGLLAYHLLINGYAKLFDNIGYNIKRILFVGIFQLMFLFSVSTYIFIIVSNMTQLGY